jgi:monofunctional glycosyltransferase
MLRRIGRILGLAAGIFFAASVLLVALYRVLSPPATPLMLIRAVEGEGIAKEWRPLAQISPHLVRAVIASEDAKFCEHHGFDWDAIREAWHRYRRGEGKLRGASTISMQTAKNVFLWPGRDWLRKALEAYFTVLIEFAWSKERIVETYLNVVEW